MLKENGIRYQVSMVVIFLFHQDTVETFGPNENRDFEDTFRYRSPLKQMNKNSNLLPEAFKLPNCGPEE